MNEPSRQRVRRSREEWQRLVEEQARSGQSQRRFCEARGISVGTLQHWKRKLAGESAPAPWLDLGTLAQGAAEGWEIELDLGQGVCLRLRRC